MILLAVETTSPRGSLCLAKIESKLQLLAERSWDKQSSHSEVITLELEDALSQSQLSIANLTHFAVDVGPGSFTGIRVGLNLIRTLAYALGKPTRIFSSLEVLAFQNLKLDESAVLAIPAIQNYFYAATYKRAGTYVSEISPPESLDRNGLEALSAKTKARILYAEPSPTASSLASMVFELPQESQFLSWKRILPLYIRRSEAEEKLSKGLLKPVR